MESMKDLNNEIGYEEMVSAADESRLNQPIKIKFLLGFTVPTIISYVILGVLAAVSGIFASRGIGAEAFGAVNFVIPIFNLTIALGAMLSMGGCALVAKKKGEGREKEARENLSLLTLVAFILSVVIAVGAWIFREQLLQLLGTDAEVFDLALAYLNPLIISIPVLVLGLFITQFIIAEGRPVLGMIASSSGAVINAILSFIFVFFTDMGIMGLPISMGIGYAVPTLIGVVFFTFNKKGSLYFVRPKWDIRVIGRSSYNGISEAISLIALTVTTTVMNNVLVRLIGWEGVAAAGMVLAAQALFTALYFGYSAGIAPVVSYHYGKKLQYAAGGKDGSHTGGQNSLTLLLRKCLGIVSVLSLIALAATILFAGQLVRIYMSAEDIIMLPEVYSMAVRGLRVASVGFLLMGFNIFATAWFTAFNDGLVSGIMSFLRSLVFAVTLLVTLPRIWDVDGAWAAMVGMETLAIFVTIFFLVKMGKKYYYLDKTRKKLPEEGYDNVKI